jgi:cation diffusion facilitator CzcD-associated flavoprotein CzcO
VPSGDGHVDPSYRQWVNENYDAIFEQVRNSAVGFGFVESTRPYASVSSPEEREAIFESLWRQGNGFRFMFGGFNDIATDKVANEAACAFIRKKIRQIVKDPEKARKLQPHDYYARRPLCDGGYFEQFNRENVDVVHLQETPITSITEKGVQTTDKLYELDVLIFATGFDAIEGNYNRVRIQGRDGVSLKEYWTPTGPTSYLGVSVPGFPNLFMITGPQGPFTNLPPAIEAHVDLISRLVARAEKGRKENKLPVIEATKEAEQGWCAECELVAEGSLFKETASWIFGQNVPGKKYALRFYFGGLKAFYEAVQKVIDNDYAGFKPLQPAGNEVQQGKQRAVGDSKPLVARL